MRYQVALLALIILISLSINPARNYISDNELKENKSETAPAGGPSEISLFTKELSSALAAKAAEEVALINQNLTAINRDLNQNLNQNLKVLNQNLAALKEVSAVNINDFISKISKKTATEPKNSFSVNNVYPDVISKTEINPEQFFFCRMDYLALKSKAVLIRYPDYNLNVFEFNPEKRWPIASLSKLMTAVIATEKMDWNAAITMTEKAVLSEGTAGDFKAGETFKTGDLVKAMLVVSSNDAAVAIAESFGEKEFINEMQKKAVELKMFQTTYLEPTGLSFINQSTVNDLAKLAAYIYFEHPEILEISRQKETEIWEMKTNTPRKLVNINKFAGKPDFLGGKTGYIEEAGRNLIAFFGINGKKVLTITLGSDDSFKETELLKNLIQNCQMPSR